MWRKNEIFLKKLCCKITCARRATLRVAQIITRAKPAHYSSRLPDRANSSLCKNGPPLLQRAAVYAFYLFAAHELLARGLFFPFGLYYAALIGKVLYIVVVAVVYQLVAYKV